MAEIRTDTTLRRKRDEITAVIKLYERQLAQARADLAHVNAAMRVFEAEDTASQKLRRAFRTSWTGRRYPPLSCSPALRSWA